MYRKATFQTSCHIDIVCMEPVRQKGQALPAQHCISAPDRGNANKQDAHTRVVAVLFCLSPQRVSDYSPVSYSLDFRCGVEPIDKCWPGNMLTPQQWRLDMHFFHARLFKSKDQISSNSIDRRLCYLLVALLLRKFRG